VRKKTIFLFCFTGWALFSSIACLWPLEPGKHITQYHLDVWKSGSGLPQYPVYSILQGRGGYLWLGTRGGLICFDGVRFSIFDTGGSPPLPDNYVRALYKDKEGKLWFGCGSQLICLDNGRFVACPLEKNNDGNSSRYNISCITGGSNGELWIGTLGAGIFRLNDGRVDRFNKNDGLSHDYVYAVFEDSHEAPWIGTLGGLYLFKNGKFQHVPLDNKGERREIYALYEDRAHNLWIGTNKGLVKQKDGKITAYSTAQGLSHNVVLAIYQDRRNTLWIGTDGGGINRMENETFTALTSKQGLSCNYVHSIFEDTGGSLWIGTVSGGLNRLKDTGIVTYSSSEGLSDDMVWCVYQDSVGRAWFGTDHGLNRLQDGKLTVFTTADGLHDNLIRSIAEDSRGHIWAATDKGLNCLYKGKHVLAIPALDRKLKGRPVSCVFHDRAGALWIGAANGELNRFSQGRLETAASVGKTSPHSINCIHEDAAGTLWVGTAGGGSFCFDGKKLTGSSAHLPGQYVLCFHEETDGALWIGTDDTGLIRLKQGNAFSFSREGGFFDFEIHQVLEDDDGYFWLSSNGGIFQVKKTMLNDFADGKIAAVQPAIYTETDGMRARICNGGHQPSGFKCRGGKLWFPTIKGVAAIDPRHITIDPHEPPVAIEEVFVDNERVKNFLEPAPSTPMSFAPGVRDLEFHYTGLSFLWPQKVRFEYILEGYDNRWHDVGKRRTAYYSNLHPGHYTFRVKACNNDGIWSQTNAAFKFCLEPYFTQTPWFFPLCAVIIILIAGGFYSLRVRSLKRRKIELERLVEERTHMLEEANRELKKIATMDGLTGIYNYRWFSKYLEREWKRAIRNKASISVILVDVDYFKKYNDAYGHHAGDECLKKVARKLEQTCRRPADAAARYGGEEFIVVLPDTAPRDVTLVAERLRRGVESLQIPHQCSPVSSVVTVSIGCTTIAPTHDDAISTLFKTADEALYLSKEKGRNCFSCKH
jgi:diguanylate cyclase (GGDEF)-like protein